MSPAHFEQIRVEETHEGRRLRLVLAGGRGNVIGRAMAAELIEALREHTGGRHLRAVTLEAEGPHFSFGASVPEHAPGQAAALLRGLHDLVLELIEAPVPVVAAVQGACLGGGLELVLPCHRIIAAPGAKLGLPEVTLGMFAPAGSLLLPLRVRRGVAEEMLLTGRSLGAEEALGERLIDQVADDPAAAALAWVEENLFPRSAVGLRFATGALRSDVRARVGPQLRRLEEIFVKELMSTADAQEGVRSFAEKRQPEWTDA